MKIKLLILIIILLFGVIITSCSPGVTTPAAVTSSSNPALAPSSLVPSTSKPASTVLPASASPVPQSTIPPSPSPGLTGTDRQELAEIITAMNGVNTFSMDSDVFSNYSYTQNNLTGESVVRWKLEKSIDIPNQKCHSTVDIEEGDYFGNLNETVVNIFYDGASAYEQDQLPGNSNINGIWRKWNTPDGTWDAEDQLSPILGILKDADQMISLGTEQVNAQYWDVIVVTTSPEAVADWVLSQEVAPGPSLEISTGLSITGKDMFIKTFKSGMFQFWIDRDTHLIMKADFSPHFELTQDDINKIPDQHSLINNITDDFSGQINFSNYNQPVSIQVPQEALEDAENK